MRIITKINHWYDNLEEGKRFAFFFVFVMLPLAIVSTLMHVYNFVWALPIWLVVCCGWRIVYIFFPPKKKTGMTTTKFKEYAHFKWTHRNACKKWGGGGKSSFFMWRCFARHWLHDLRRIISFKKFKQDKYGNIL